MAEGWRHTLRGLVGLVMFLGLAGLVILLTAAHSAPEGRSGEEEPVLLETPWMNIPGTIVA